LVDFGLVYIPPSATNQFYPTRLATTLTSDATALRSVSAGFDAALTAASGAKGFIIIETNYRLYAYTNSPLQIAVLALFTRLGTRYPNMVSGRISRVCRESNLPWNHIGPDHLILEHTCASPAGEDCVRQWKPSSSSYGR